MQTTLLENSSKVHFDDKNATSSASSSNDDETDLDSLGNALLHADQIHDVVWNRTGTVLSRHTVLKSEFYFPSFWKRARSLAQRDRILLALGVPGFRSLEVSCDTFF